MESDTYVYGTALILTLNPYLFNLLATLRKATLLKKGRSGKFSGVASLFAMTYTISYSEAMIEPSVGKQILFSEILLTSWRNSPSNKASAEMSP